MKTRSQTLSTYKELIRKYMPFTDSSNNISESVESDTTNESKLFDVNIDFDDASIQWNKNKKKLGNGMYAYKKVNTKKILS